MGIRGNIFLIIDKFLSENKMCSNIKILVIQIMLIGKNEFKDDLMDFVKNTEPPAGPLAIFAIASNMNLT